MSQIHFPIATTHRRNSLALKAGGTALASLLLTATMAHAVNRTWSAPSSGDFNDGANWNPAFQGIGNWSADIVVINGGLDNFPTMSTGTATLTEIQVGNLAASVGKLAVTGGSITLTDNITIGRQGTAQGTFELSGGGSFTSRQFRVGGGSATAVGTATVSGAGTTLNTGSGTGQAVVNIGAMGTGTLTLENGAVWNATLSNPAIGADNNAAGITGTGVGGNGTLNIRTGAVFNANNVNVAVGRNGNGVGNINVTDGGQFNLIKGAGTPFLNLANRNGNSTVPAGANFPVANVTLSGATSAINVPYILVGYGTATLNLNGGTLTTERISKDPVAGGSATIHFNGTRIKATTDIASFVSLFDNTNLTLDVAAGGLHFDTDAFNVGITQALPGAGGLTKYGSGTLTLTGQSTYTGDTTVNAGTLQITTSDVINILPDTTALRLATGTTLIIANVDTETVDTFYIDGVPQAAGIWGPLGSGVQHESGLILGDGLLQVTRLGGTTPTSPFVTWATTKGLTGNDALATADPDHDGYNNLLEFILGGEPNPATPGAGSDALTPTITTGAGNHAFTFRQTAVSFNQPGLLVGYQYGSDLTGWTPAVHNQDGVTVVLEDDGSGIHKVKVTIPDNLSNGGKIFVRMNALQQF